MRFTKTRRWMLAGLLMLAGFALLTRTEAFQNAGDVIVAFTQADKDRIPVLTLTGGGITANTNSFIDANFARRARVGQWIVADAYTLDAEMRQVSAVSGNTVTVTRDFLKAHPTGCNVQVVDDGVRNVRFYGARGDRVTNDSPAIQAAVDDFDVQFDPVGGMNVKPNNLYFPVGEYVIGSTVDLPALTPYFTAQVHIWGSNATLLTNSFTGPFFDTKEELATTKYVFKDLSFRDNTTPFGTNGTAHVFGWRIYRMHVQNCHFTHFAAVIKSNDTSDVSQFIQSVRFAHNFFDTCVAIVEVSKAWDFEFVDNKTDSCPKCIHILGTSEAALINGRILNNTFEGAGVTAETIRIRGAFALTIAGNYFENNTAAVTSPEIDLTLGQQPRGITIQGNNLQTSTTQNSDRNWFPIALNQFATGVLITGNHADVPLIDPHTQTVGNGEGWEISNNYILGARPFGPTDTLSLGTWVRRMHGYVQTASATPTRMNFHSTAPPMFHMAYTRPNSTCVVQAKVAASNTAQTERAGYELFASFFFNGTTLTQQGATTKTAIEADATWDADFLVTNEVNDSAVTMSAATNLISDTAHGLSDGDIVFFTTTGALLSPLRTNRPYFVRDSLANTYAVTWAPGQAAIDLTGTDSGTHTWHNRHIDVNVTGDAGTVRWFGDVEVVVGGTN